MWEHLRADTQSGKQMTCQAMEASISVLSHQPPWRPVLESQQRQVIDPNIRVYADDIKNLTRINDTDSLTHLSPREAQEGSIAQCVKSFRRL